MSQPARSHTPSTVAVDITEWLKPPRSEALARLRTNSLGLITLAILTHLLPLPSPWTALAVVRERISAGSAYYYLCLFELLAVTIMLFNVAQSLYALKYPSPLPPPSPSPAKTAPVSPSPPPRQWRLKGLTPTSSPQRQKAFSYVASPVSTPSRTLNYSIPPSGTPLDASFSSSLSSSVPSTPASPLAAYRGRHGASTGRAFDGSLLSRLRPDSDDED
ncbi:hypothetical protein OBBRIDRAFT_765793 [Obba rivulosa]|uniref:Uncharacterized protein n=1 Tax=Obba rivulosa TaxID=1052685 RepID=A0A8E2DV80_9APHY|nr:hypothetical protein OBBRIDRAFT_765793 [Obba rivulosa]